MGRVYAVVSAKGGVGKTTTAANLAAALAAAGPRVVVVDGDLGMPNLAATLGVEVGEVTLHDLLTDDSDAPDVAAAVHDGPHGLAVVPGSPTVDAFSRADPERLEGVLSTLAEEYDYVVLDTGAGLSNDTVAPMTFVDEVLLVSTPTRDALGDTDRTREVAERLGVTVAGAALVRTDPAAAESEAVVEALDVGVLGTVPEAAVIQQAAEAGEPVVAFAPDSRTAGAFASLAAALTGEHVGTPDPGGASTATDSPPAEPASGGDESESTDDGSEGDPGDESDADAAAASDSDPSVGLTDPGDGVPTDTTSPDGADAPGAATSGSADDDGDDDAASPVEPADPDVVASVGDDDDGDGAGVYSTPLEEVPIDEAEPSPDTDAGGSPDPGSTDDAGDAGADTDSGSIDGDVGDTDADDDGEADADDGGGLFSRFFG